MGRVGNLILQRQDSYDSLTDSCHLLLDVLNSDCMAWLQDEATPAAGKAPAKGSQEDLVIEKFKNSIAQVTDGEQGEVTAQ